MDFNVTKYKKFIGVVSCSDCNLTFGNCHLLIFGVISKNIHNYFERLFKYSLFFRIHIHVRLDFLYN